MQYAPNHYPLNHPLGPIFGISLDGLRCIIEKDDTSAIDYPPLEEYRAKYPSLHVTHFADIIGKYGKKEKLRHGVYKVQDRNGRLL